MGGSAMTKFLKEVLRVWTQSEQVSRFSSRLSLPLFSLLHLVVSLLSLISLLFSSSLRLTSLAKVSILGASPLLIRLPADTSSRRVVFINPPRWQQRPRIHFGYGAIPRVVGNLRKLAVSCIGANRFAVQIR